MSSSIALFSSFSSEFINSMLNIRSSFKYLQLFCVKIFFLKLATLYINTAIIDLILFFIFISFNNSIVIFVGVSISLKKFKISEGQSLKVSYTLDIIFSSKFFRSLNKKSAKSLKKFNLSVSRFFIK